MSQRRLIQLFVFALMCAAFCSACFAQNCSGSGSSAWNEWVHYIDADCVVELPSPDKRLLLKFAADGRMSIGGKTIRLRGRRVEPPAMFSWSPRSDAFFINDGEGSGMTSTFRLFKIRGALVYEDKSVERAAVSTYRRGVHCRSSALDPDVWGFGWGEGGKKFYLLVQATVHEPCGPPYGFVSLVVRTSDGKILETLSEKQTQERFGALLPSSFFSK